MYYNRYRYYSHEVGRFISKDPIGLLGGLNGYTYAPNPVSWVDPLGLNRNKNPNNWLQYHENGSHRGHTIDRHVGKSDCYLRNRLQKIPTASTYPNQQVAEDTISKAFKQNRQEIKEWAKTAQKDGKLVLDYHGDSITGKGVRRGNPTMRNKTGAKVVLKSDGNGKYGILTSYPN